MRSITDGRLSTKTQSNNVARRSVKTPDHLRVCVNIRFSVIYKQMTYEA